MMYKLYYEGELILDEANAYYLSTQEPDFSIKFGLTKKKKWR